MIKTAGMGMVLKYIFFGVTIPLVLLCGYSIENNTQQVNGEDLYRNCSGCHQSNGMGIPGFYPPHVKHVPDLFKVTGGRQYVVHVVLNGLNGVICVNGKTFGKTVPMPGWSKTLNDDQIASVLNYISFSIGKNKKYLPKGFEPFTASEISKERNNQMTPEQVHNERNKLFGEPCLKK